MISLIVAKSENNVIGSNGKIPWHIPEDLRYFKKITMGATVIMGRKTFESIGKPLPGRKNIILSGKPENIKLNQEQTLTDVSVEYYSDKEILTRHALNSKNEIFVIGGAELYALFLPVTEKLYITEIQQNIEGTVRFPLYNRSDFIEISREPRLNPLKFDFVVYQRISKPTGAI